MVIALSLIAGRVKIAPMEYLGMGFLPKPESCQAQKKIFGNKDAVKFFHRFAPESDGEIVCAKCGESALTGSLKKCKG